MYLSGTVLGVLDLETVHILGECFAIHLAVVALPKIWCIINHVLKSFRLKVLLQTVELYCSGYVSALTEDVTEYLWEVMDIVRVRKDQLQQTAYGQTRSQTWPDDEASQ